MTVIDLGVPTDHDPGPPPAPRWLLSLGIRRPLAALAAGAACVALLGAAAPAEPDPIVHQLEGVTGDGMSQIAGDSLVTFVSGTASQISAYGLYDGKLLWSVQPTDPVGAAESFPGVIAVHTAPDPGLISGDTESVAAEELWISAGTVTGYDTRTGAVRWTRSGGMVGALGQSIMMFTGGAEDRTMLMIDPSTGQARWQRPLAQGTQWTQGWHVLSQVSVLPDAVVELAADGTVTAVDTATGRGSALGRIPPGGTLEFAWQGVLGVRYGPPPGQKDPASPPAGPRSFAVFDIAGLTPLWSTPLTGDSALAACGTDTLCDWRNGERRLDLHTGRDITGETQPVDLSARLRFGRFGAWNVVGPDQDTWLVYANPGTNQPGSGWLGRVDPNDPKMHVALLVKLPGRVDQCLAESTWLVCSSMNSGPGITYAIRRADLTARPPLR